jgi:hypothetical protein
MDQSTQGRSANRVELEKATEFKFGPMVRNTRVYSLKIFQMGSELLQPQMETSSVDNSHKAELKDMEN